MSCGPLCNAVHSMILPVWKPCTRPCTPRPRPTWPRRGSARATVVSAPGGSALRQTGFEVTVDFPGETVSATGVDQVLQAFHRGTSNSTPMPPPIRLSKLSTCACAPWGRWSFTLPRIATAPVPGTTPAPVQTRPVYFSGEGFRDTPVYARATLQATHVVRASHCRATGRHHRDLSRPGGRGRPLRQSAHPPAAELTQ